MIDWKHSVRDVLLIYLRIKIYNTWKYEIPSEVATKAKEIKLKIKLYLGILRKK